MAHPNNKSSLNAPVKRGSLLMMAGAVELLWAGIYYAYGNPPTATQIAQQQRAAIVVRSAQDAFNKTGNLHLPIDARHNPIAASAINNCLYLVAETVTPSVRVTTIEQGRLNFAYPVDAAAINRCLQQRADVLQHRGEAPAVAEQSLKTVHATAAGMLAALSISTIGIGAWRRYRQPSVL